jgi:ABC-type transporter MlaC component
MFKQIATIIAFIAFSANVSAFELNVKDLIENATPMASQLAKVSCEVSQSMATKRDIAEAKYMVYSDAAKIIPAALGKNEIQTKANIAISQKYAAGASAAVLSAGCLIK